MSIVLEIEDKIKNLPPDELVDFRVWFEKFDADTWDEQFESDVNAGKLDTLAQQAINDFKQGYCKPL
jgi:hypothetical protein